MYACMYAQSMLHVCIYASMYICMYVCMYAYVHVCMNVCMNVYIVRSSSIRPKSIGSLCIGLQKSMGSTHPLFWVVLPKGVIDF